MIKRHNYTIIEMMFVIAMLASLSSVLFVSFYKYHWSFRNIATNSQRMGRVLSFRQTWAKRLPHCSNPKIIDNKLMSGNTCLAEVVGGQLALNSKNGKVHLRLPDGMAGSIELDKKDRTELAVLNLSWRDNLNSKGDRKGMRNSIRIIKNLSAPEEAAK
ncbi:MAG: hypothetical protein GY750_09505 [Lentisphaerae bacterium]|nr:hypothetical protein [Lentisphaerota bacterium]MCP4101648.1 hypothetical protein [Lentisphaerota bacterium]